MEVNNFGTSNFQRSFLLRFFVFLAIVLSTIGAVFADTVTVSNFDDLQSNVSSGTVSTILVDESISFSVLDITRSGITLGASGDITLTGLIEVSANNVIIEGFTITNNDPVTTGGDPLVLIDGENITFSYNNLVAKKIGGNEPFGIRIAENSAGVAIFNNMIESNGNGGHPLISISQGATDLIIELNILKATNSDETVGGIGGGIGEESRISIINNSISDAKDEGIWFWPVESNSNLTIKDNEVLSFGDSSNAVKFTNLVNSVNGYEITTSYELAKAVLNYNSEVENLEINDVKEYSRNIELESKGYFPTIQAAIDAAVDGDTIYVSEGIYEENLVIDTHNLTLIGNSMPILNGSSLGSGHGIRINTDNVTIRNFEVTRFNGRGVYAYSNGVIIDNVYSHNNNCSKP